MGLVGLVGHAGLVGRVGLVGILGLVGVMAAAGAAQRPEITVFAAADLGPPFRAIVPAFESQSGTKVTLVLGSTGMLAQQIRNGAPADVFFAADDSFVRQLASESLAMPGTVQVYARGRLALVTRKDARRPISAIDQLSRNDIRRIAIANPQHAPYGRAAREVLQKAGLWSGLESRLVFGENVQQAVQFVRSGSVDAGLVARSVADTPDLAWTIVDAALHEPLNQTSVVIARTRHAAASQALVAFLNGSAARTVMSRFGFLLPGEF